MQKTLWRPKTAEKILEKRHQSGLSAPRRLILSGRGRLAQISSMGRHQITAAIVAAEIKEA
jgi:hypothetical protein